MVAGDLERRLAEIEDRQAILLELVRTAFIDVRTSRGGDARDAYTEFQKLYCYLLDKNAIGRGRLEEGGPGSAST